MRSPLRFLLLALLFASLALAQIPPDAIFVNGKVVTVDPAFSIQEAFAVRDGRIVAVDRNATISALAQAGKTTVHDLGGRTVLPGLIDSHVHAASAAVFEFDHPIPTMESVGDVLDYIAARTKVVPAGQWIKLQQVFITRL